MNITSVQFYKNQHDNNDGIKVTLEDGSYISVPLNPANRHYQAILEWVAEGNTIQEAD